MEHVIQFVVDNPILMIAGFVVGWFSAALVRLWLNRRKSSKS